MIKPVTCHKHMIDVADRCNKHVMETLIMFTSAWFQVMLTYIRRINVI